MVGTRSSDKDVAVTRLSYSASKAEAADPGLRGRCHADEGQGGSNPTMVLKVGEDYTGIKPVR